ncbi:MAG TPA: thiosulfate oxidation carrier protein SoxY [Methylococcaceae bacterium]|nr:thiosulfate oxidation carrier protein SoxY [Methylococcaceae bacterium]
MIQSRRSFVRTLLALSAAGLSSALGLPVRVWAKNVAMAKDSGTDSLEQAIAQEIGDRKPVESDDISLEIPQIAEDGAVVPISVESRLAHVESILIFVEKNPTPLAAHFRFDRSMDAFASLHIKMNESCDVIVVVKAGGEFFSARKKVKVVVGGCG